MATDMSAVMPFGHDLRIDGEAMTLGPTTWPPPDRAELLANPTRLVE
jgi:hypothetical protein